MTSAVTIGTVGGPSLLHGDLNSRRALLADIAQAGIDHLFIADHISFHNGFGMDGIVNAATLAAMHPDLKVIIGVYLLALRHPVPVARQLSSLSLSAPGRIVLGVGIGGEDRHEMEICGVDPATRGRRTNHCLAALDKLLQGQPSSYECDFFSFKDALIKPAVKPSIPVLIGGRSTAALKRTAEYGSGWLGAWCSPKRFRQATGEITLYAEAAKRTVSWQHGMQIWVGLDTNEQAARNYLAQEMEKMYRLPFTAFEKYSPYGTPEKVAEFLQSYVEQGVSVLNIKPCATTEAKGVELLAEVCEYLRAS